MGDKEGEGGGPSDDVIHLVNSRPGRPAVPARHQSDPAISFICLGPCLLRFHLPPASYYGVGRQLQVVWNRLLFQGLRPQSVLAIQPPEGREKWDESNYAHQRLDADEQPAWRKGTELSILNCSEGCHAEVERIQE